MSISLRIKIARKNANLSQSDLASLTSKGISTIYRYEKKDEAIPVDSLVKISEVTNTDITWLIYGSIKEIPSDVKTAQLMQKLKNESKETIDQILEIAEVIIAKNKKVFVNSN